MKKIGKVILDLFFPLHCVGCDIEGIALCTACRQKLSFLPLASCPWCERASVRGFTCDVCKQKRFLMQTVCCYDFSHPLVREIVHACKYQSIFDLGAVMGKHLAYAWQRELPPCPNALVVPVPLHRSKTRSRGFNQAALIARVFSQHFGYPCQEHILKRTRATATQTNLSKSERALNMKEAFSVCDAEKIQGKTILLIDDVCTTGATLESAARELQNAGAREVVGFAFARG